MHELSIALSIVNIAETEARKYHVDSFTEVELEIGTLSGIALESLDFVWPAAVENSVLKHAEKKIHIIEAKANCFDCNHIFITDTLFKKCPQCESNFTAVICGKELRVKSLVHNT